MEYTCSRYLSNNRFLISRLFPTHRTKLQSSSLVISRSFPVPIPEYAAASSKVKFAFSQIGISFMQYLRFPHPTGKLARFCIYKTLPIQNSAVSRHIIAAISTSLFPAAHLLSCLPWNFSPDARFSQKFPVLLLRH